MKTLVLVRHAKSSWKDPLLRDFDRPLNKRGKRDAPEMGERLRRRGFKPDALISSPAIRAAATAEALADALGYGRKRIIFEPSLYEADPTRLLDVVYGLDGRWDEVMVVAHNPGLTDLINGLVASPIDNIPTCGVVVLEFSVDDWSDVAGSRPERVEIDYPKNH